jgi:hypothetical protein
MRVLNQNVQLDLYRTTSTTSQKFASPSSETNQQPSSLQQDAVDISDESKKLYIESQMAQPNNIAQTSYSTTIYVRGYDISIEVGEGYINIDNDSELEGLADRYPEDLIDLARSAREIYRRQIGESFDVSSYSMAFEIVGHIYPDRVAEIVSDFADYIPGSLGDRVKEEAEAILRRTRVVNIGEDDGHRWFFDALGDYLEWADFTDEL